MGPSIKWLCTRIKKSGNTSRSFVAASETVRLKLGGDSGELEKQWLLQTERGGRECGGERKMMWAKYSGLAFIIIALAPSEWLFSP